MNEEVFSSEVVRISNAAEGVRALRELVRSGEATKIQAAAIIDHIERNELWREVAGSFKEFMPTLLEDLQQIGWKSSTQIKRALAVYRVFLEKDHQLLTEAQAQLCLSHLYALCPVAPFNQSKQVWLDEPKKNQLTIEQFTLLVDLVVAMVTNKAAFVGKKVSTREELLKLVSQQVLDLLERVMGERCEGWHRAWTLWDTQTIIDFLLGTPEKKVPVKREWQALKCNDGSYILEYLRILREGEIIEEFEIMTPLSEERLLAATGSDAKIISSTQKKER